MGERFNESINQRANDCMIEGMSHPVDVWMYARMHEQLAQKTNQYRHPNTKCPRVVQNPKNETAAGGISMFLQLITDDAKICAKPTTAQQSAEYETADV